MAFPCLRIPPSKESCAPPAGNPKTQEIRHPHPAFLQNRLLAQVKSQRSINRFRILHGRLTICGGEFIRHRDPRRVAEQGRSRTPLVGGRANHPNPSGKDASLWLSITPPLLLSAQPPLLESLVLAKLRHSP